MHNLHLPLSWVLSDKTKARYDIINLGKKWNWIYTAQIPSSYLIQNPNTKVNLVTKPNNRVIRGCDNNLKQYLKTLDYKSIRLGQEAVLDLNGDHFKKKSIKKLIQRGARHGKTSGKKFSSKHKLQLDELKSQSAHGNEPQLSYLFNSELKNDMQLFVFENSDRIWLAALTITRQSNQKCQVEILIRRKQSPVGIMETLIYETAKILKKEGYRYFSLGEVPFIDSKSTNRFFSKDLIISTIGRFFSFAYNYKGLYRFKNKFTPQWFDIYLCSQKPITFRLFYALFRITGFDQLVKHSIITKLKYLF